MQSKGRLAKMNGDRSSGILFYSHNQEKYVKSGLDSILSQKFDGPAHLIIIDDGSPDNTVNVIETWIEMNRAFISERFESINFTFRQDGKARGQTATLLEGLGRLETDYLFILEGDDEWILDSHISEMRSKLDEFPWLSACGSSWISLSDSNQICGAFEKPANLSFINSLWDFRRLLSSNFQTLSAMGYRGEVVRKFLPKLILCKEVADLGLNIFVSQEGPIYWCDQVSLKWRFIPTSAWRKIPLKEQIFRSISMLKEYSLHLNPDVAPFLLIEIESREHAFSIRSKMQFAISHPLKSFRIIMRKFVANKSK